MTTVTNKEFTADDTYTLSPDEIVHCFIAHNKVVNFILPPAEGCMGSICGVKRQGAAGEAHLKPDPQSSNLVDGVDDFQIATDNAGGDESVIVRSNGLELSGWCVEGSYKANGLVP